MIELNDEITFDESCECYMYYDGPRQFVYHKNGQMFLFRSVSDFRGKNDEWYYFYEVNKIEGNDPHVVNSVIDKLHEDDVKQIIMLNSDFRVIDMIETNDYYFIP